MNRIVLLRDKELMLMSNHAQTNQSTLTIISSHVHPLKPLIMAAIQREVQLLDARIRRTEQRISSFETQYGMSSAQFLRRHQNDELAETHAGLSLCVIQDFRFVS